MHGHWGIENRVHWVLDVIVHEDASRIRTGDAPQHMGVVRHIALNLLRQEPGKGSVKTKRFRAALNDAYLERVLGIEDAIALGGMLERNLQVRGVGPYSRCRHACPWGDAGRALCVCSL